METITGTLSDIKFSRNGFLIGRLNTEEAIKGNMSEPVIGQIYRLTGEWEDDPKWGRQFKFQQYFSETPRDAEGIYLYLVRVARWVGPITGRQIIKTFGDKALAVLKHDPQRAADAIKGLTLKRALEISQNLLANEDREAAAVELETMFGGQHLPKTAITALIEKYHSEAPAQVRANPYSTLMEIRGIGFNNADRVALAIGYELAGLDRQIAGILYALQDAANTRGHTWLPGEKFIETVQELIGLPPSPEARIKLLEDNAIRIREEMIALSRLADDELEVAGMIRMLLDKGEDLTPHISVDLKGLAPDQQEAFRLCMAHPVFILTGAPGTGKTFTLKRIIDQFTAWNYRVSLVAPTGKAAKRMSEMVDMGAMTIHRLLGPEARTDNGELSFSFHFGRGFPLPTDLLVVDEFSMVDVSLAASLFRAVAAGIRVLIVGDHYQLPSVGPGAVLRDLLAAGVPSYELTEIKRNTGDIVRACHAIKAGRPAIPSPRLDMDNGLNLRHIEEPDPFKIQEIIRDLVCQRLPMRGYNPVWDVQVLSPMNEKTALSCMDLNILLQGALNLNPPLPGTPFRMGDKVLQRKNEGIGEEFVVNGDLGEIEFINDKEIGVLFHYPDRQVKVKRKSHHLQLAYCITIHKMQGSEAPVIILPLHSSFGAFFNRELVYTALSRARDICLTVGQWSALEQAVGRVSTSRRITRLTELIRGE